ncbi:MAG: hypothetical protein AAFV53_16665, partial [Myxococcota bacterium]
MVGPHRPLNPRAASPPPPHPEIQNAQVPRSFHKLSKRAVAKIIKTAEPGQFFLSTGLDDENTLLVAPPGRALKSSMAALPREVSSDAQMTCGIVRMDGKRLVFQLGKAGSLKPSVRAPGKVQKVLKTLKAERGMGFLGKARVTLQDPDEVVIKGTSPEHDLIGTGEEVIEGEDLTQEEMLGILIDDDETPMSLNDANQLLKDRFRLKKKLVDISMMELDSFQTGTALRKLRREGVRDEVEQEERKKTQRRQKEASDRRFALKKTS